MKRRAFGVWLFTLSLIPLVASAGGPLVVGSSTFGVDGKPFVWDNSVPIQYRTDGGSLGALDNATANLHVAQAFQVWATAPGASISFQRAGAISGVADGDVDTLAEYDAVVGTCRQGTQTPVIFDANGTLFQQLFGDDSILGFAGPCALSAAGKITSGQAALSGLRANTELFDAAMIHEFGHLLGLDHSQVDCHPSGCQAGDNAALPTMNFQLQSVAEQKTLAPDDIAWLARLYPDGSNSYGLITGRILFSDGKSQVQDAVVIARRVDDPSTAVDESRTIAISSISGYRFTGNPGQPHSATYLPCTPASLCPPNGFLGDNTQGSRFGSRDVSLLGLYEIPVLAGQYTVEVSSIQGLGTVEIGPLDTPLPLPSGSSYFEYWNINDSNSDESSADSLLFDVLHTPRDVVTVTAGSTVTGIDIVLNGTPPTFDQFEHALLSPPLSLWRQGLRGEP
jgi:Matrixin